MPADEHQDSASSQPLGGYRYAGRVRTHALGTPALSAAIGGRNLSMLTEASSPDEVARASARGFQRVDLVVEGIEHAGPSFEVRVFGNNEQATAATEPTEANGYLGSFHVFGHGLCLGDEGHCEISSRGLAADDLRRPHPLRPKEKSVTITEPLGALLARQGALNSVTLVPIAVGEAPNDADPPEVLHYKDLKLVTYD